MQSNIDELKNFKKEAESRLPDFASVAAEKGDLEDQLRILQKVTKLLWLNSLLPQSVAKLFWGMQS